jgi:hypothetical protein
MHGSGEDSAGERHERSKPEKERQEKALEDSQGKEGRKNRQEIRQELLDHLMSIHPHKTGRTCGPFLFGAFAST